MPDTELPTDVFYGKVMARLIKTVADSSDPDVLSDEVPITGTLKFSPLVSVYKNPNPNVAAVVPAPIFGNLDENGYLVSEDGNQGVWLAEGPYKVNYNLGNSRIRTHRIQVLRTHNDENPLNLAGSIPPMGPVIAPSEYSTLSARIDALNGVSVDDPRLSDARTPLPHDHDDRYYTETEINTKLEDFPTTQDLANETTARQAATGEIWETLNEEVAARGAADAGFETRLTLVEEVGSPDLTGFTTDSELAAAIAPMATESELASGLATKANVTHAHTSASIIDFREAVEDAMASTLVGAGITITHEDGSDTITLTGVGGADVEAVRDAIGAALIGVGPISIVPNDAADTIVITVSATVNDTDANLRNRATHTGAQAMSTVTGLEAALAAQAVAPPVSHGNSHKKDTGTDPLTPADIGAATAAQGAKADTAVQPAALTAALSTKSDTTHTHDDRYYTETEVDALIEALDSGSAGGMGDGLWRGPWATLSTLSSYDLSSVPSGWTAVGSWSSIAPPTTGTFGGSPGPIGGTPPTGTWVLSTGTINNTTKSLEFVVPAGAAGIRIVAASTGGHPSYSLYSILKNGSAQAGPGFSSTWTAYTFTAVAGDVIRLSLTDSFGFSGSAAFGQIEVLEASAPYMFGHTVTYANRLWRSGIDNNASTPGADGNWIDLNIAVDPADIVGSTTVSRALMVAADAAAARAAISAGNVSSTTVNTIVSLTQSAYDALTPKVSTTLYIITGA